MLFFALTALEKKLRRAHTFRTGQEQFTRLFLAVNPVAPHGDLLDADKIDCRRGERRQQNQTAEQDFDSQFHSDFSGHTSLETESTNAISAIKQSKEVPPLLTKGRVTPVFGMAPVTTMMFIAVCKKI